MRLSEFSNDTQLNELLGALGKAAGMAAKGAIALGKGVGTTVNRLANTTGRSSDIDTLKGMQTPDGKPMNPQKAAQVAAKAAQDQQAALKQEKDEVQKQIKDQEKAILDMRKRLQDINKAGVR